MKQKTMLCLRLTGAPGGSFHEYDTPMDGCEAPH